MNCIVICLDTLRRDALGCYDPEWVRTPCIDGYARRATRFETAYCGSFPTVPMRVDCYTGAINWPRYGWKAPDPDQPKLPELLREAGYHTGLVLDTSNNVKAGLHGFYDEHVLITKDVDDGIGPGDIEVPVPAEHYRRGALQYRSQRAEWSGYRHEEDWFVARTMRAACNWLEDNRRREKWFLWVDTFEIHEDWMPPQHYLDLYAPGYDGPDYTFPNYGYTDIYSPEILQHLRDCYAAEVTLTDRWVGHLLRQVELLGLFENTSVILISDHGMYIGEHGRCGKHTVDPEDPWPYYDEVAGIPLLVWTPFENTPRAVNALCQAADVMPTVLDLCGLPCPPAAGRSWKPLLTGETDSLHERVYTSCFSGEGEGRFDFLPSHITVNTPVHTAIFGRRPHRPELYDRAADPGQIRNLAELNPELVDRLRSDLVAFMSDAGADQQYIDTYALGR